MGYDFNLLTFTEACLVAYHVVCSEGCSVFRVPLERMCILVFGMECSVFNRHVHNGSGF